ncbi:TolC family protein [Bowmanella denitrificans]|uniref:TolC family protein n=1 Tax=Bowmanella denitrificans TaxID=366582 RepID=UPI000C9B7BC2|nr:TolC family protein [Bowmanella denitrificans]
MNFENFRARIAVVGLLCLLARPATAALGQSALSLKDALQASLKYHPTLSQYPYEIRAMEAERLQAGLTPNPNVSVELENVLGSGDSRGLAGAELTLTFSQLVEMGDKRDMRLALQDRQQQSTTLRYEWDRLEVLADTAEKFYQVLRYQQLRLWNRRRIEQIADSLNVIRQRAGAGAVSDADVSRMAYRLAEVELEQGRLDSQWQEARFALSQLWLQAPTFTEVAGDMARLPALPTQIALDQAVNSAPELRLLQQQYLVQQARLNLEQANGQADITLNAGVRHNRANADTGLVFGLSMPLNWQNPNQGNIDAALATMDGLNMQQAQRRQRLRTQLQLLLSQAKSSEKRLAELQTRLLPQAQQLLQASRAGYQHGQISVLQLLDAQEVLFGAERQRLDAQLEVFELLLAMQRLSGQPLIDTPTLALVSDAAIQQQLSGNVK